MISAPNLLATLVTVESLGASKCPTIWGLRSVLPAKLNSERTASGNRGVSSDGRQTFTQSMSLRLFSSFKKTFKSGGAKRQLGSAKMINLCIMLVDPSWDYS